MRGECTHKSTGTGRLGLPCWQSGTGRGGPEKGHRRVQARSLSDPALSCYDAQSGCSLPSQNTAPYEGSLPVECLSFSEDFISFFVLTSACLLTWNHMQMMLFTNHIPRNLSMCGTCLPVKLQRKQRWADYNLKSSACHKRHILFTKSRLPDIKRPMWYFTPTAQSLVDFD